MSAPSTIVTGAGSGIGRATAVLLARAGHRLTLCGRSLHKLQDTHRLCLEAGGPEPIVAHGDLADSGVAHAAVDRAVADHGALDNLVCCAGVAPKVPIADTDEQVLEDAFFHNAFAPAFMIVRAWPHFRQRKSGCAVLVGSLASIDPFDGFLAYGASKAAVDSYVRSMHREGRSFGMRAFSIAPGAIETPLLRTIFPESVVPRHAALPPEAVATVILDCIEGRRDAERGKIIVVK
jgi:NAD(P)-dependent dehydrogenase (short-subunit alcohol dehydrogenase family)